MPAKAQHYAAPGAGDLSGHGQGAGAKGVDSHAQDGEPYTAERTDAARFGPISRSL